MHDARIFGSHDLISSDIGRQYLARLTDKDNINCVDYLHRAPITHTNQCLAIILGIVGSGKSFFSAELIVARLLGNPEERILIVAASNQPSDVLIRKVNDALHRAKEMSEQHQNILGDCTAVERWLHVAHQEVHECREDPSDKRHLDEDVQDASAKCSAVPFSICCPCLKCNL